MTRMAPIVRPAAAVVLVLCVGLVLYGVLLGLSFEPTSRAQARSQRGQEISYPAVLGGILAIVALAMGGRRAAVVPLALAAGLAIVSLAILILG